ncbi:molybdopterin-binding protein [Magnetospira sp. QH-2]|uniref:competence/damage-inducible protein A n=1 Tax=Magnetospira sp. (strain QH-2) TaxID=1288970 RepID=UPI0005FA7D8F|nr:molybdopterin-binding protein [Magnetospira sp. QH-2]
MTQSDRLTACLIVIGNEVLSGRTRDANIQILGQRLSEQGIDLVEARVIPDVEGVIIETIKDCRQRHDVVFTSGGIGPTHDDITAVAVAKAFGVELRLDPRAEALLRKHYKPEDINAARLKMAHIPAGAGLIANPVSQAPGFSLENVHVMAGVPRIFEAMLDGLLPTLPGGMPRQSRTVAAYLPEGHLAGPLAALQNKFPGTEIGSYPFVRDGKLGAALVARSMDPVELDAVVNGLCEVIRSLGGEPLMDTDPRSNFDPRGNP